MKLSLSTVVLFALFNVITGLVGRTTKKPLIKLGRRGSVPSVPTKQLNDGNYIPTFGLGTFGADDIPKLRQAIIWAVAAGYRYIDTASAYGNEFEIGQGIRDVLKNKLVKREDLYITAKLWNDKHRRHQVVPALKESLANLGLRYVDLYLIHSPEALIENVTMDFHKRFEIETETDYLETWAGMEEAKALGLTKSIGVSNFNTEQIDRIKNHRIIVPAVNQIEVHPSNTQVEAVRECFERNIAVVAYSPFGFFVSRGKKPGRSDPKIRSIAKTYNKTVKQVILRYLLDRYLIPLPRSTSQSGIEENIAVFDFHLTPTQVATISSLNTDTSIFG